MAATRQAQRGLGALIRRGWNELPDIVGGTVVALIGIGLCGIGLVNYYRQDGDNRRYKASYVVLRPEDPRASKVHKD